MNLNPLVLEALRSRAESAADPALQTLLSGLDSGSSGGVMPSTQELLSQLESTNPTMGLISKYLAARQAAARETNSQNEAEIEDTTMSHETEEQRLALEQSRRLAQVVQRLESEVKKLRAELEQLREKNDAFAAALGACYLCWGEDAVCPICRGTGRAGAFMPDRRGFAQFVAPAIRRFQAYEEVNRNNSKNRQSDSSI